MKNFSRHITLFMFVGLFIISSTGVYLTIHNCSSENITELFFFTPLTEEPCEHHAHSDKQNSCGNENDNHSCSGNGICCDNLPNDDGSCSGAAGMPECCSNTVLYIAVEDDFTKSDQSTINISYSLLQFVFAIDTINAEINNNKSPLIIYIEPPPDLYGKGLALFNRILLL